jgi:cell division protein FtsB
MSVARSLKRKAQAAIAPAVFLSLVAYFLWQATQGDRGLKSYALRQEDLRGAQAELQRAEIDMAAWERRVTALRTSRLDPDALDERSRAMLNLSDPSDVIVPYGSGKHLF